jgi:hypothetical protein
MLKYSTVAAASSGCGGMPTPGRYVCGSRCFMDDDADGAAFCDERGGRIERQAKFVEAHFRVMLVAIHAPGASGRSDVDNYRTEHGTPRGCSCFHHRHDRDGG